MSVLASYEDHYQVAARLGCTMVGQWGRLGRDLPQQSCPAVPRSSEQSQDGDGDQGPSPGTAVHGCSNRVAPRLSQGRSG